MTVLTRPHGSVVHGVLLGQCRGPAGAPPCPSGAPRLCESGGCPVVLPRRYRRRGADTARLAALSPAWISRRTASASDPIRLLKRYSTTSAHNLSGGVMLLREVFPMPMRPV